MTPLLARRFTVVCADLRGYGRSGCRAAGRRIACPVPALWGAAGALDTWYADESGPLERFFTS